MRAGGILSGINLSFVGVHRLTTGP